MKSKSIFLITFLTIITITSAIEVGGHLTEDTVWSPENNPYLLIGNIFIDEGITLTILPGTIINLNSALLNNDNYVNGEYFMLVGEESVAKMFWVDGQIIAEGTEQDSIIFTRDNDILYNHWGTIYFNDSSQKSLFKHCLFEFSSIICIDYCNEAFGAISGSVTELLIRNCTFRDNYHGIFINIDNQIEITNNSFYLYDGINPEWLNGSYQYVEVNNEDENQADILFSGNCLPDSNIVKINNFNVIMNNNILSNIRVRSSNYTCYYINENQILSNYYSSSAYYQNSFLNREDAYIDNNSFESNTNSSCSFYLKDGIISNNSFNNIKLSFDLYSNSETYTFLNNTVYGNRIYVYENYDFCNNIFNSSFLDFSPSVDTEFINCFFLLTYSDINYSNDIYFYNCSIFGTFGFYNLMFQNCITIEEIPSQNDGGGNIQIEESALDSVYVDYYGNDFHLVEGSLAIDAGLDTTGYYYPFDLDYNQRIWDGNGNGTAIIDIGPYEYDAPSLGGIEGYTYNPLNGEIVDYVLLKINNQPGEFTFSNNNGSFEHYLPSGVYDIYTKRMFYEDVIIYDVEVIEGEFTQIFIPLVEMVKMEEYEISYTPFLISNLYNYPNPFNSSGAGRSPATTITFSISQSAVSDLNGSPFVNLEIYNIKGQKVKILVNQVLPSGEHSVIWDGKDSNGNKVSSGIYFYKLKAGGKESAMKKMLLLK